LTAIGRLLNHRTLWPLTCALLAACAVAGTLVFSQRGPMLALLMVCVAAVTLWLAASSRYEVTLLVVMVYLGLLDGYLKLRVEGTAVTAIRDVFIYSILVGAVFRWWAGRSGRDVPSPRQLATHIADWARGRQSDRDSGPAAGMEKEWALLGAAVLPLAWLLVVLVQLINPDNGTMIHSIKALRPHLEFVGLFFVGYFILRTTRRIKGFLLMLAVIATINGVVGLVQTQLSPAQFADWGPGYEERIEGGGDLAPRAFFDEEGERHNRPFGLGSDMSFGGQLGVLALPGALALCWWNRRRLRGLAMLALTAGSVLAVVTSTSRSVVIAAVVVAAVFPLLLSFTRRRLFLIGAVAAALLASAVAIGAIVRTADPSSLDRFDSIAPDRALSTVYHNRKGTLRLVPRYAADHPLGAGLGSVGPAAGVTGAPPGRSLNGESEYTFLLVEVGIPGLLILLAMNLRLAGAAVTRIRRAADDDSQLALAALAAPLVAVFVAWFASATTATSPYSPYFWLVAGALWWWLVQPADAARSRTEFRHGALTGTLLVLTVAVVIIGILQERDAGGRSAVAPQVAEKPPSKDLAERVVIDADSRTVRPSSSVELTRDPAAFAQQAGTDLFLDPAKASEPLGRAGFLGGGFETLRAGGATGASFVIQYSSEASARDELDRLYERALANCPLVTPCARFEQGVVPGIPGSKAVLRTPAVGHNRDRSYKVLFQRGPYVYAALLHGRRVGSYRDTLDSAARAVYRRS
jgi:O-antigen ligase